MTTETQTNAARRRRHARPPEAEVYDLTTAGLAKAAGTSYSFAYQSVKAGRIEHVVASSGAFLFRRATAAELRRLRDEGWSRRGVRKTATAPGEAGT